MACRLEHEGSIVEDTVQVVFLPSGKRGTVDRDIALSEAAQRLGEDIESICGGRGVCGKCKVRALRDETDEDRTGTGADALAPPDATEREAAARLGFGPGERLACRARLRGNAVLFVPEMSRRLRAVRFKGTRNRTPEVVPAVRKVYAELPPPGDEGPVGTWEGLAQELERRFSLRNLQADRTALQALPGALEAADGRITVTVWQEREVLRVEPGYRERGVGLAVDLGTTTVAATLCDLGSGEDLAVRSVLHPQVPFGEDIMTRMARAEVPDTRRRLQAVVVNELNRMVGEMTGGLGLTPEDVAEAVLVGNTAMHHLFLGWDTRGLSRAPFHPVTCAPVTVRARDLGLAILPSAPVNLLPIEAGFVGADNVAVLLAEQPHAREEVVLIIDIGTNGEIVLGNRDRLLCASCATGPAFEGGCVRFGMRAAPGAIEKVRIDRETLAVNFRVVGDPRWSREAPYGALHARGLCGSGIIDAVAEMLAAGIIAPGGRMNQALAGPRLRLDGEGVPSFVIAQEGETAIGQAICVTQGDVRSVQLAKGALLAGCQILLARLGRDLPDRVILAGAFGTEIDRERALAIGLFPDCGLDRITAVGNAAGDGARIALLDRRKREEAERIARRVEHVSLTTDPAFTKTFVAATVFPAPGGEAGP